MNTLPTFEVIIPFAPWRRAVMSIMTHPEQVATGTLVRDPGRSPTGLLVDQLTPASPGPTGANFPPLSDWLAVAAPRDEATDDPQPWIRRLEPRFAQLLVILLVGLGRDRSQWRGWAVERGAIQPLAGLQIVGPGMVHARTALGESPVEQDDPARWSRLRGAVGEKTFASLREARVAVVGCSRTGSLAAGMLASLGIRGLTLLDGDVIEPHNLDGMLLATGADIGKNKAITLGHRLVEYQPELLVRAMPRPLTSSESARVLSGVDLVVTCVDQDGPRLRVAHWARERLTPHLDIGSGVTRTDDGGRQLAADVRLLLPGAGCIRCVGGLGDMEQAEYELHAPAGALPRRPPEAWNARGRLGSLVTLNSMAVSFGIQSWLDLLNGTLPGSIWHRLRWTPIQGLEVHSALMGPGETCSLCR